MTFEAFAPQTDHFSPRPDGESTAPGLHGESFQDQLRFLSRGAVERRRTSTGAAGKVNVLKLDSPVVRTPKWGHVARKKQVDHGIHSRSVPIFQGTLRVKVTCNIRDPETWWEGHTLRLVKHAIPPLRQNAPRAPRARPHSCDPAFGQD